MYGFGDDRNPANDTINVMEEILVEYIVDVVRPILAAAAERVRLATLTSLSHSAKLRSHRAKSPA